MLRSVQHVFNSPNVITDITGQLPNSCTIKLSYAKAEKIVFREGTMYNQYFSHFLFLLELTTVELHTDLEAGFINQKKRLFLFIMLKGRMSFFTEDGFPIITAEENTCYATYNRKGKFCYHLPKGTHQFFYIIPRTAWLERQDLNYPSIGQFLKNMNNDHKLYGHLSPFAIDVKMHDLISKLFSLKETTDYTLLEIGLLKNIKAIINHYQLKLDKKNSSLVYSVQEYINENYADVHLNNKTLADHFFVTVITLIRTFKQEFNITPYNYLVHVRMKHAKALISTNKITITQIYPLVGYSDFQSFRKQFKKYFGVPPSSFK
ncbi:helix-turn-helix transcriptional regulator [Sphingobacterium sp. HSC-15S19]|uniref:AraC family transcriptional regulator n=1 Tax=Sphingobacterium TaxID=28453 RepID=UPI003D1F2EE0